MKMAACAPGAHAGEGGQAFVRRDGSALRGGAGEGGGTGAGSEVRPAEEGPEVGDGDGDEDDASGKLCP